MAQQIRLLLRFIQWGAVFTKRNLVRNLLAVVSFALATATLIAMGILASGKPATAGLAYRQFIGGDLIVLRSQPVVIGLSGMSGPLEWKQVVVEGAQVASFVPMEASYGTLHGQPISLEDAVGKIGDHENVAAVYPYHAMTVLLETPSGPLSATLRARLPELDLALGFTNLIVNGRYFSQHDRWPALIDSFRPDYNTEADVHYGYASFNGKWVTLHHGRPEISNFPPPEIGSPLIIRVPGPVDPAAKGEGGSLSDLTTCELQVVGHYQVLTHNVHWLAKGLFLDGLRYANRLGPNTPIPDPLPWRTEPHFWTSREILVPLETFRNIVEAAGWEQLPQVEQVGIILKDMSQSETTVQELQELIGGNVIFVPDLVQADVGTPEPSFRVPLGDIRRIRATPETTTGQPPPVPAWVRTALMAMTYLLASIMFLGNIYVLLLGRRNEIAVLKSVGATPALVVIAFGTEVLLLSSLGALLGWLAMSPLLLIHWSTSVGLQVAITRAVQIGGIALLLAAISSVLFGVVPIMTIIRRSPVGVLKGG